MMNFTTIQKLRFQPFKLHFPPGSKNDNRRIIPKYQLQKLGLVHLRLSHKIRHKMPEIVCEHFKNVRH